MSHCETGPGRRRWGCDGARTACQYGRHGGQGDADAAGWECSHRRRGHCPLRRRGMDAGVIRRRRRRPDAGIRAADVAALAVVASLPIVALALCVIPHLPSIHSVSP